MPISLHEKLSQVVLFVGMGEAESHCLAARWSGKLNANGRLRPLKLRELRLSATREPACGPHLRPSSAEWNDFTHWRLVRLLLFVWWVGSGSRSGLSGRQVVFRAMQENYGQLLAAVRLRAYAVTIFLLRRRRLHMRRDARDGVFAFYNIHVG